jgi:prephenate dehydratase
LLANLEKTTLALSVADMPNSVVKILLIFLMLSVQLLQFN